MSESSKKYIFWGFVILAAIVGIVIINVWPEPQYLTDCANKGGSVVPLQVNGTKWACIHGDVKFLR